MKLINFHCHLFHNFNSEFFDHKKFFDNGNNIFLSNALDERELDYHISFLNDLFFDINNCDWKKNFLITAGQHPLYPEKSIREETVIDLLELNKIFAIGEIGFDKRCKNFEWQKNIFLKFLDIANQFQKPVIIHCVGYYYDLLSIIKKNFPKLTYILHSFNGSIDIIDEYNKINTVFSLHKRILKTKKSYNVLKKIIEKYDFVFETDIDNEGKHNIKPTIQSIANFINKDIDELIEKQYKVYQSLLKF